MKAREFDKKFDDGDQDLLEDLDLSTSRRPNQVKKRINADLSSFMTTSLGKKVTRLVVTRQSIKKVLRAQRRAKPATKKARHQTNR